MPRPPTARQRKGWQNRLKEEQKQRAARQHKTATSTTSTPLTAPSEQHPKEIEAMVKGGSSSPGGRTKEQLSSRAAKRHPKQIAYRRRLPEAEGPVEHAPLEQQATAVPSPPLAFDLFDTPRPSDSLPVLTKVPRADGFFPRSLNLSIGVNRRLNTWMSEQGGQRFIPVMEALIRALLREDQDYQVRVKEFADQHGRQPTADEVPRGPMHESLRAELNIMMGKS